MLCLSIRELKVVLRYVVKSAVRHLNSREMAFYGIVGRIKRSQPEKQKLSYNGRERPFFEGMNVGFRPTECRYSHPGKELAIPMSRIPPSLSRSFS